MNNQILWAEYKKNPTHIMKKEIILRYTNLVHYVIQHSRFISQNVVNEEDYFQFGVEGLSEAIERFDPEYGTKFETYAIQRIRGKIIDELRKLQAKTKSANPNERYHNVSLHDNYDGEEGYQLYEMIPDNVKTPEEELDKKELKTLLVEALKGLNERDRLVITLYYYENLNYKEIADILKITVSRVSQIHTRIISELKSKVLQSYE